MGRMIIKVDRDEDLYLEWSSIVEAPTFVGTRAEILRHLGDDHEYRLVQADKYGSSGYQPFVCYWDDKGEIYKQEGWLLRQDMATYAHRLLNDINAEATDLLEPFEDEEK